MDRSAVLVSRANKRIGASLITANGMIPPRAFGGVGPWLVVWAALIAGPAHAAESHAIAMHGAPALPADFTHFGYANPAAPKGGRLVQGVLGSFDSLNPFTVKGPGAAGSACSAHLGEQCDHRIRGREPDGAWLRRAVHALWAAREERRDGRRAHARDLHARSGCALLGRQTRDGRRRRVHVAAAARSRPAEPPHLLFQGHQGRRDRRAPGALRPWRGTTANCR